MKAKNKTFWLAGCLFFLFGILIFVKLNKQTSNNIKIGGILILSGEGATWGESARNGMEMAIEEINEAGGINGQKLEAIYEDDHAEPKKSVSAFQKLTELDKVKFIIGTSWSVTGLPLTGLAKEKQVVIISPSLGVKDFNEANEFLFNTWPHDYILSEKLAEFVFAQGKRNVAIFGANEVWVKDQTDSFKKKFESLGGKVSLVSEPLPYTKDVGTEALKAKNNQNLDGIILTTDGYGLTYITAQKLREIGVNLPIYSITLDKKIISNCADACDNVIFLTFLTPIRSFEEKYKKKYNREVEIGADSAYDAIMMLVNAIKKTRSTDPIVIKNRLAEIKNYSGASGQLISDGKRGFIKAYKINIIKKGKILPFE